MAGLLDCGLSKLDLIEFNNNRYSIKDYSIDPYKEMMVSLQKKIWNTHWKSQLKIVTDPETGWKAPEFYLDRDKVNYCIEWGEGNVRHKLGSTESSLLKDRSPEQAVRDAANGKVAEFAVASVFQAYSDCMGRKWEIFGPDTDRFNAGDPGVDLIINKFMIDVRSRKSSMREILNEINNPKDWVPTHKTDLYKLNQNIIYIFCKNEPYVQNYPCKVTLRFCMSTLPYPVPISHFFTTLSESTNY